VPVICLEGSIKSGGYARFDITEPLNSNFSGVSQSVTKTIPLTKCPDPEAYVEVTFHYELLDESSSTSDDMRYTQLIRSVLNVSSRDFNMSHFDFGPDLQDC